MTDKKKVNILITASTYPRWAGDSTPPFVQQFAEVLSSYCNNIYVLAPHAKGSKKLEQNDNIIVKRYRYFYPAGLQNITYNGGGVYKIKKTPVYALKLFCLISILFFQNWWIVISKKIDIINPHWAVPQGFVAVIVKFLTNKPVLLTVHGGDIFNLTGDLMTKVKRFVLKNSDIVCVNSRATEKACQAIYDRHYEIIPMGIDFKRFKPQPPAKYLIDKYNLQDFSILFVGRLADVKGVIYMCQALKLLGNDGYQFKALIVGDGPLRQDLQQYVTKHNLTSKIIFTGWVDQKNLKDYYNVADVFVGPSLSEPQGLVFIEALASGVPVIASKVGGIVDIVDDEKNGFLVKPQSSRSIYKKLKLLIDDSSKLQQLKSHTRQNVEQRFAWQNVVKKYNDVLDKLNNL
jgi:glycosyltransferase involved in cell wall biosynthesis